MDASGLVYAPYDSSRVRGTTDFTVYRKGIFYVCMGMLKFKCNHNIGFEFIFRGTTFCGSQMLVRCTYRARMFVLSRIYGEGDHLRALLVHIREYVMSRRNTQTYTEIWESAVPHYLRYGIYLDESVRDLLLFFHSHTTSLNGFGDLTLSQCNHHLMFLL